MGKFKYHSGASLRESAIEKYLSDNIDAAIRSTKIEYNLTSKSQSKPVKSIQSYKEELTRLNTLYQKGRITEDYYEAEYERLSTIISGTDDLELKAKQEKLIFVEKQFQGEWKELYNKLDNSHKRSFWKQIIEEIYVDPNSRQISGFKLLI